MHKPQANDNHDEIAEDLMFVMGDHRGRRLIWNLLGICGKGHTGMVPGSPDSTAFNLGKLDVALAIEGHADFDQFVQMMREAKEAQDNDRSDQSGDQYRSE